MNATLRLKKKRISIHSDGSSTWNFAQIEEVCKRLTVHELHTLQTNGELEVDSSRFEDLC